MPELTGISPYNSSVPAYYPTEMAISCNLLPDYEVPKSAVFAPGGLASLHSLCALAARAGSDLSGRFRTANPASENSSTLGIS